MDYPYAITSDSITVVIDNKVHTVDVANANFNSLKGAIRAKNWPLVKKTVDLATALRTYARGAVQVTDSEVLYNGIPLSNGLTNHILAMMTDGFDVTPLVKFLEKTMENPSFNSRNSLYRFVDANKITLYPDGDMLLYKNVKKTQFGDLVDIHSRTFNNNVGSKPSVKRADVDDNPINLCSYGLHVGTGGLASAGHLLPELAGGVLGLLHGGLVLGDLRSEADDNGAVSHGRHLLRSYTPRSCSRCSFSSSPSCSSSGS